MPKKSKRAQHPSARPFQDRIPIPAALNTGAVVGQLGSNVKWISRESGGAWIFVKDDHAHISANDAGTLARARQLLKAQFKAAIQVGKRKNIHLLLSAAHERLAASSLITRHATAADRHDTTEHP